MESDASIENENSSIENEDSAALAGCTPAGEGADPAEDIDALAGSVGAYEAALETLDTSFRQAGGATELGLLVRYFHLSCRLLQLGSFTKQVLHDRFATGADRLDVERLVEEGSHSAYNHVDLTSAKSDWAVRLRKMPLEKRTAQIGIANCNTMPTCFSKLSIENAEMTWNCP